MCIYYICVHVCNKIATFNVLFIRRLRSYQMFLVSSNLRKIGWRLGFCLRLQLESSQLFPASEFGWSRDLLCPLDKFLDPRPHSSNI